MVNKWKKLGRITAPIQEIEWISSHASSTAVKVIDSKKGLVEILVTGRDSKNRSLIGAIFFNIFKNQIIKINKTSSLNLGPLGSFDENGQSYPCLVVEEDHDKLYYTGWSPSKLTPFQNFPGLATRKKGNFLFRRFSNAPIMERTNKDYSSIGSLCVLKEKEEYKMWYTSFVRWDNTDNISKHYYNIKYASSKDGINWKRKDQTCINFKNSSEYAIAKPTVIKRKDKYIMFYCYRGNRYMIGYAVSNDGINWERKDHLTGLNLSENGWDSEEINYPTIFSINNDIYMLYSGNNYGKSGFGLAKLLNYE